MNEYATLKALRKETRLARRERAAREYFPAQRLAAAAGLRLVKIDDADWYRLSGHGWTWDIRISVGYVVKWENSPRLQLPGDWSLEAVVLSAARLVKTKPPIERKETNGGGEP